MTTSLSASLVLQDEVKRSNSYSEPKAPLTGGGEAPTKRSEFFTQSSILYLHGFRSSPESSKAQLLGEAARARGLAYLCPQLPESPAQSAALALDLAQTVLKTNANPDTLTVVGSSLGGYYANWLAERLGCRAVLLNPAVYAARDLVGQVGTHTHYHDGSPFVFKPEYIDELAALATPATAPVTRPGRYFLLACTGDEVLDWREMSAWYAGCHQRIVAGGDHGISDFARWLPEVLNFASDAKAE